MNKYFKTKKEKKRTYQICVRCVMDTSDPWIEFDSKGICNHCKAYSEKSFKTEDSIKEKKEDLEEMFDEIKKLRDKKTKYDVAIGISGGVDSSYVTYLANQAGLKVLAIHMDNCWDTATAIKNINNLIALKNVDYHCEVLNWENFKSSQRILIESGLPDIELPTDSAITAVISRVAVKYGIKTILSGGNYSSEGILPAAWMYNPKDSLFIKSIFKKAGKSTTIFKEFKFSFRDDFKFRFLHKLKTLYPLNSIFYEKEKAKNILKKELNWQSYGGKHCECLYTKFCQLIYQPMRHGMDYRRAHLSTDICNKRISRQEAINILKVAPWEDLDLENELSFIANKLGYELSELKDIISKPGLWYKDYANNEFLLGKIYNLYRFLTGRPLAKSWWG